MKRRRLKWIDRELNALEVAMESVKKDSNAYRDLMNRYGTLIQMREDITKTPGAILAVKECAEFLLKLFGGIGVPLFLGWLAYSNDKDLKLANGRVWNLVGKKFDK